MFHVQSAFTGVRVFVVIRNSELHNLNPDFPIERTPSSDYRFINPFAPEPPVRIHVPSTTCDVISFNGRGQLCPLTSAE